MTEWITSNEAALRLGFFLGILVLMVGAEAALPRRQRMLTRLQRWTSNLGIVVINTVVLRLLFPAAAVGMALFAQSAGWGIFNTFQIPFWFAVIVSVLVLDFMIWLQHVMVHAVPALWRLHRVHHADLDFDVTTGLRFHPLEIILSMVIKFGVIALLGAPVLAVILFEILLNATSMFNHSNLRLPLGLDRVLRWFVVTPDMHRVHHSVDDDETNSNFGFNLPWWDRLFGTYKAQPREGHEAMTIGISTFRDPRQCDGLKGMLLMPFVGKVTDYAINRRQWEKSS
ncbi:MAG: sterol desaturase family protein [Thioalkalivibrio sp.]